MKEDTDDEEEVVIEDNQTRAKRLTKRNVLKTKMEDEYERTLLASGISIYGMDKDEIQQLAQVLLLSKQDASEICDVDDTDFKKIESCEADSDSTQAPVSTSQDLFHSFSPASVEDVTADIPLQEQQCISQGKDEEETQLLETDQPPPQATELSPPHDDHSQEQNPPSPVMNRRRLKLSSKKVINKDKEVVPRKNEDDEVWGNRHPLAGFFVDMQLSTLDDITESSKVLYRKYRSAKCKMLSRFELYAMGVPWTEYTKVILKYFNDCQRTMLAAQRTLCWHSAWGEPVKVGRHHTNTIDIRRRGQPSVSMELSDEETDNVSESLPTIQQTLALEDPVIDTDSRWLNMKRTTAKRTPRIESSSDEEFETIKSRRLKKRRLLAETSKKKPWFSKEIDETEKCDSQKIDEFFREETEIVTNTPEDNLNLRKSEAVDQDLQISQSSKSSSTVSASQGLILNEMGDIYSTQMFGKKADKSKMALDSDKSTSQGIDIECNYSSNKVDSSSRSVTSKKISELECRNIIQATALASQGFDIDEMKQFSKTYTIKRKLSKDIAEYDKISLNNESVDDEATRSPVFERSTKIELTKIRKRSSSPKENVDANHIKTKCPVLKLRKTTLEFDHNKRDVASTKRVYQNENRLLEFGDEVSTLSELSDNFPNARSKSTPFRWNLSDDDSSSMKIDDRNESRPSRQEAGVPGTSSRSTHQMDEQGDHSIKVPKKKSHVETVRTVQCPLCEKLFSPEQIEEHASECVGPQDDDVSDDQPNTSDVSDQTCYICDRVLAHALYKDHLRKCLSNARQWQERMDQGGINPSQEPVEKRYTRTTLRRRPLHEERDSEPVQGNTAEVKGSPKNQDLDYSPVVVLGSSSDDSYSQSESSSSFDEDDVSLKSVVQSNQGQGEGGNSPITTFKSITDLKDSLVDFKNQFTRKSKKRKASATTKSKTRKKPRKRKRTKK